ncbi:peptidase A24 [Bacillus sp. FJAT-27225]|uniref:A24 family peptidase n=1 Tax=Bacillus sp. FJAT-27225 TaxID=1743144 RepID=UPI00080C21DB|nr:A24 family peptidase [Bacillus sp. FJAT-27225]OCA87517.1 peptidase A24 [Bacillus sp. FJAT-27225]
MENILLLIVLIICTITDIKFRKILNIVTFPAILLGFLYYLMINGFDGFLYSGKGFLVGLGVLLIPFAMGGIGAGDVKLMAAIGTMKGAFFVFYAFLYAAIVGGFIALFIIIRGKDVKGFIARITNSILLLSLNKSKESIQVSKKDLAPSFPYGVAIAIGTVAMLFMEGRI